MLDFKPLTLEDKEIFDKYLKPYNFLTCEYSFTNLFIWRIGLDIQYTIYKGALIIKKKDFYGNYHFMQPIGCTKNNLKDIIDTLETIKINLNFKDLFKDAEAPFIDELKAIYGEKFIINEDRNNFDYIYESSKLIQLSGKKLHGKKNHYNNFIKNNNFHVEEISKNNIEDCIEAACKWCKLNDCKGYLKFELNAIKELLTNKDKLDFIGMAVYVSDELSAFTIGERINDNMAIIHIEKADAEVNGLYTYINKTFIENYFSDVPFINREQDLGKEGLRKAKLSYQPLKLEPKYSVS
jgi:uncharacterized protein